MVDDALPPITRRRKALFAALTVLGLLLLLDVASRLLARDDPAQRPRTYRSVERYLEERRAWVEQVRIYRPADVTMRVPEGTADSFPYEGEMGHIVRVDPRGLSPGARRVLLFGSSAAYGFGVPFADSLGAQLEAMLRREGAPPLRVLNLARPAWELVSQVRLVREVVAELPHPPEAVVLYAGNNEFYEHWLPPRIGARPWESLGVYRLLKGWLTRPRKIPDPHGGVEAREAASQVWSPSGGLTDASFWPRERALHVEQYRRTLKDLVAWLRARKIVVVLVPPPVNLGFFAGSLQPQPLTYAPVSVGAQAELGRELRAALGTTPDLPRLERLTRDPAAGPLQHWALGQLLDRAGRHAEAARQLSLARDRMWGYLAAVPTLASIVRELRQPGVGIVDDAEWYPSDRPVRELSRELFIDACHPSRRGHELLAREIARLLERQRPSASAPAAPHP
jgi:lysophospholipase L1-like esterase